jgi:hypothetical protein
VVLLECAVLAINGGRCPLTDLAAKYTADRASNFDIYLPNWLADHNKLIFGLLFVVGEFAGRMLAQAEVRHFSSSSKPRISQGGAASLTAGGMLLAFVVAESEEVKQDGCCCSIASGDHPDRESP